MSSAGHVQCPILVGRDDLLEHFDKLIAEALAGRGSAVFLSGRAGLGKTRLMRAAARKAEAAGLRVDGGAVAPQDHQVPLASINELAVGLRGDENWGSLSQDLLAIDGRHDGDALGARRLIVRAAADRILEAIDRPSMLEFADLHWTDEMSLEVIGELARHVSDYPLLLVADYRGDEFPADGIHREWRSRLLNQRHADEIRLRPLTLDETGMATTLILGGELPAPREVVEAVHERTNGIPLHIEELLAALDEEARSDGRLIREAHVPDTIGDAVLVRLERLSADAQEVARAGAVIGRCFRPDVLAGVMDRPIAELEPAIQELEDAAILYPFQYVDGGYYDFRHQLLRDAIYDALPPSQLRRFHALAAEHVMSLEASSVVHASRHYEKAGLRSQAFRTSLSAADEASRISARQEAYELYHRAVANMPDDLPPLDKAKLFDAFSGAANAIEHNEDSEMAAIRARQLYLEAGEPIKAAEQHLAMFSVALRRGEPTDTVQAHLAKAFAEIADLPPSPEREGLRLWLIIMEAECLFLASDLPAARQRVLEARELAASLGDREGAIDSDISLARIDILDGNYESGMRDGLRACREARDAGFESTGVTGYRNMALLAARILDPQTAEAAITEGLQYADAIEQSHCRQMIAGTLALLDWGAGRWEQADARGRQDLSDRGCRRGMIGGQDVLGLVAMGRGRTDEARRWLDESLALGRRIGEVHLILTPLWGLAETELQEGRVDAAAALCQEAWSLASASGERALFIPFVVTGVRSLIADRRPDEAAKWLAQVREFFAGWESIAGASLSHAEGLVRLAGGSLTAAREALERALRGWEERGRAWEAANARIDLAQCLVRMNRHVDAADVLEQANARAQEMGSPPLVARADEVAKASRGRGREKEPWRPLTVREFEVARLIAEGLTNAEIAAELSVSPKTVSAHVEHILAKLGVGRRTEVAAWAASIRSPEASQPATPVAPTAGR
ncbi:MAG TPA: LuxR C-terminal-related transcriptional regulator [Candidatus Limnocylindria bacterium]|nr:LuxR C-terminal-related transcriptional regulator [Candidatus Limnocylindria bacterium]